MIRAWLILYLVSFSPSGELLSGRWIEEPHPSPAACEAALERVLRDWDSITAHKAGTGIIGRCSDRPLGLRRT